VSVTAGEKEEENANQAKEANGASRPGAGPNPTSACGFGTGFPEIYLGHCHNGTDVASRFRFYGHYDPNSPTFSSNNRPEQRTPPTAKWVAWNISAAHPWCDHTRRASFALVPVVQEMVDHPGWTPGRSAWTFMVKPAPNFSGNQYRRVMVYERGQPPPGQYSARLLIWYQA
jgi:hypothetical protein